jgi:transcriptional regulator with XRE-family HTH domain
MHTAQRSPGWRPDDSTFGARLALVRHACGWNAKEAALACGLPFQSWRNWEMNGRLPRDLIGTCHQIAEHTGVDVAWLAGLPRKDSNLQPAGNGTLAGIFDWSVPSWHDALGLAA